MNKTGSKSLINSTIETCKGLDDPKLDSLLPAHAVAKLREDVTMVRELCPAFDKELYLAGEHRSCVPMLVRRYKVSPQTARKYKRQFENFLKKFFADFTS